MRKKTVNTRNNSTGSLHHPVFGDLYARRRIDRSFFGYDPSILKSGIQKYARRAEVEKGIWCVIELDLFSLLECNGAALNAYLTIYPEETLANTKGQAKRLRTNMVNRLVVMMSEEVSISAWWMPSKIFELYEKWIKNRGNVSSRKYLFDIYSYLISQKKIRLISDLKSVYLLPPYYVVPDQMNDLMRIHCKIREQYPGVYSSQAVVGKIKCELKMDDYPPEVRSCIAGIVYNLDQRSDNVFYWISKLCDFERKDWVVNKKGKNIFNYKYRYLKIVWDILDRYIDRNSEYEFVRDQICALYEFYKKMTHKEKPIYLYHAVLLIVRRNEIEWASRPPQIDSTMNAAHKLYSDHLLYGKMALDDYVMDLHTKRVKKSSNCMEKFALEGAFVTNENDKFLNKDYREIYILLKKELDRYNSRGGKR